MGYTVADIVRAADAVYGPERFERQDVRNFLRGVVTVGEENSGPRGATLHHLTAVIGIVALLPWSRQISTYGTEGQDRDLWLQVCWMALTEADGKPVWISIRDNPSNFSKGIRFKRPNLTKEYPSAIWIDLRRIADVIEKTLKMKPTVAPWVEADEEAEGSE